MKNMHIVRTWLLMSGFMLGMNSCTANFEEANRPGHETSLEELGRDDYAVSSFITELQNFAFPEQENLYQNIEDLIGNYLGRYMTYAKASFSVKNYTCFNAPDDWKIVPWRDVFAPAVSSFNSVSFLTQESGPMYGLALILRAQLMLRFTDTYGPLPVGLEEDANAYSSQETIYNHLIKTLDQALDIINPLLETNPNLALKAEADHVYQGKMQQWVKFANSLKLRMAIRMSAVSADARQIAEEAYRAGVLETNEDNCMIVYVPNGQYKTSVEWGDSRACADLESYMSGFNDPRVRCYFQIPENWGGREIIGCRAGANVTNKDQAMQLYSAAKVEPTTKGVWMTAAEMTFCRAEGALKGWNMGGTPKDLYEKAIRLSFEQWGVGSQVDWYLTDANSTQQSYTDAPGGFGEPHAPVSTITIQWDDQAPEAEKMERLIVQKWIALFPDGQEGWNEIRRTGYPKVFPVMQATSGYNQQVPNRVPLDPREITGNNKENYRKAVEMLGGKDDYAAKMWWQK